MSLESLVAACVFARKDSNKGRSENRIEVQKHVLLYGSVGSKDEFWRPLVEELRPFFKTHLEEIWSDYRKQSPFARFLTTKAGDCLLVDALVWLQPAWELAGDWFWDSIVENNDFGELLDHAWRHKFTEIRKNPTALKAFKLLTLKLSAHHVPIAIEVQQNLR